MKNILDTIVYLFIGRYKLVDSIRLETGVVCKHYYDRKNGVIIVKTEKYE
tara:strand:- start:74 stop:223 length:150 start_codon:yes stop_codon:yes gene_type:complete